MRGDVKPQLGGVEFTNSRSTKAKYAQNSSRSVRRERAVIGLRGNRIEGIFNNPNSQRSFQTAKTVME
jgi:hypothetical protein